MAVGVASFDLISNLQGLLSLVVGAFLLFVLWKFRHRVLALLTGDDRVHTDPFDSFWFTFCTCCGCCTGSWTKCISCLPCFDACGLRNRNLVDALGHWSGMLPVDLRVSNVVVGDLPTQGPACYYVEFEAGELPAQRTTVSPLSHPKLVQFPGECVISVRDNSLDNNVRVIVREMMTLGSSDICQVSVEPEQLVQWARRRSGIPIRLQMTPMQEKNHTALPGWILLSLEECQHLAETDHFMGHALVTVSTRQAISRQTVDDFKTAHPLVNARGVAVPEPAERDAARFYHRKKHTDCCRKFCCWSFVLAILLCTVVRLALVLCYREYLRLTVLHLHGVEFPVDMDTREWVLERCGYAMDSGLIGRWSLLLNDVQDWEKLLTGQTDWGSYSNFTSAEPFKHSDYPRKVEAEFEMINGEKRMKAVPGSEKCNPPKMKVVQGCYNLPVGTKDPWAFVPGSMRCRPWTCRGYVLSTPWILLEFIFFSAWAGLMYWFFQRNKRVLQSMYLRLVQEDRRDLSAFPRRELDEHDGFCLGFCGSSRNAALRQVSRASDGPIPPGRVYPG